MSISDRARELLAAEYEADFPRIAATIRRGGGATLGVDRVLRAITRALSSPAVGEGEELVERLRGLLEKATKGPWRIRDGLNVYTGSTGNGNLVAECGRSWTIKDEEQEVNATLIVEAVNALPALLDRLATPPHDRATIEPEDGRSPSGRAATASPPSPAVSGIAGIPNAGELRLAWREGAPPHPWDKEWFIAITTFGDRVVLRALPEEWSYDFTTADDTYIRKECIAKWMQFPDSNYIAPASGIEGEAGDPQGLHPEGESPARSEAKGDAP